MADLFISYRRDDSQAITDRIHEHLTRAFGDSAVFKDVDDIPIGADFRQTLQARVHECAVLLVVIGRQWLEITGDDGRRRLDDPDDFVRIEIEAALNRDNVLVVPVLVNNATMPPADQLPEPLRPLAYRNSVVVRNDPDFKNDITRLINRLQETLTAQDMTDDRTPPINRSLLAAIAGAAIVILLIGFVLAQIFDEGADDPVVVIPENPVLSDPDERVSAIEYIDAINATENANSLSSMRALIGKAGLEQFEGLQGPYTLFVPHNDAFTADGVDVAALTTEQAGDLLYYLVADGGAYTLSDMRGFPTLTTHRGETLNIAAQDENTVLLDGYATVIPSLANLDFEDGIIHIVDRVPLPDSLS